MVCVGAVMPTGEEGEEEQLGRIPELRPEIKRRIQNNLNAVISGRLSNLSVDHIEEDMKCISDAIELIPNLERLCNGNPDNRDNHWLHDLLEQKRLSSENRSTFKATNSMPLLLMLNDVDSKIRSNFRELIEFKNINKFKNKFEQNDIPRLVYDLLDINRLFGPNPMKNIAQIHDDIPPKVYCFMNEYLKLVYMGMILCTFYESKFKQEWTTPLQMEQLYSKCSKLVEEFKKYRDHNEKLSQRLKNEKKMKQELRGILNEGFTVGNNIIFERSWLIKNHLESTYPWIAWFCISLDNRKYALLGDSGYKFVIDDHKNGGRIIIMGAERDWKLSEHNQQINIQVLHDAFKPFLDSQNKQIGCDNMAKLAQRQFKNNLLESIVFVCSQSNFKGQFGFDEKSAMWINTDNGYYVCVTICQ